MALVHCYHWIAILCQAQHICYADGLRAYLQPLHDAAKNVLVATVPILLPLTPPSAQQIFDVAVKPLHSGFVLHLSQ